MRSAYARDFESLSKSGFIHVRVVNVGSLKALFTVSLECSASVTSVPARQLTLHKAPAEGSEKELTFQVFVTAADDHVCVGTPAPPSASMCIVAGHSQSSPPSRLGTRCAPATLQ